MLKIIFFFLFSIILINTSNAQDKIVYIDMNLVLKKTNLGKSILKKITQIDQQNIKKLKLREKEINELELSIKDKQNLLSQDSLAKEVEKINKMIINFSKEKNSMIERVKETKENELKNFYTEINPILDDYVNKNNIDLILDIKTIIMGKTSLNVTQDFIDVINKEIPIVN